MFMFSSLLVALKVAVMTTCVATNDDKVCIMKIIGFQCLKHRLTYINNAWTPIMNTRLSQERHIFTINGIHIPTKIYCNGAQGPASLQRSNAVAILSANGSAAFKWKLRCHWLKGLRQLHVAVVIQVSTWGPYPAVVGSDACSRVPVGHNHEVTVSSRQVCPHPIGRPVID